MSNRHQRHARLLPHVVRPLLVNIAAGETLLPREAPSDAPGVRRPVRTPPKGPRGALALAPAALRWVDADVAASRAALDALEGRRLMSSVSFVAKPTLNVGDTPTDAVYADLNNDAKLDLVVGNGGLTTRGFGVYLGDGAGGFTAGPRVALGNPVTSVVAFDYTNDGNVDVAVATRSPIGLAASIQLFINDGAARLTPGPSYAIPTDTVQMGSADFNGDGLFDGLSVSGLGGSVNVLLANRDGTLQTARTTSVGVTPTDAVIGDFNEDGKLDLVVQSLAALKLLPGNGDGTFASPVTIRLLPQLASTFATARLGTSDLNNDGHLDLAVPGLSTVATSLLGQGDGTFAVGESGGLVPNARVVDTEAVDLDGNGTNDIVGTDAQSGRVVVNLLDKVGHVTDTETFLAAAGIDRLLLADFTNDLRNDVVSISRNGDVAHVLVNTSPKAALTVLDASRRTVWFNGTPGSDRMRVRRLNGQLVATLGELSASVTLGNFARLEVRGGDGNDVIDASAYDRPLHYVDGGAGNDSILGGKAADRLRGGLGNDTLVGGAGNDRLEGYKGSDVLVGAEGDDKLYGGDNNDRLDGGGGRDQLFGEAGNDSLVGGAANDHLIGGAGDDSLWGNLGTDHFDGGTGRDWSDHTKGELTYSIELAGKR